MSFIPFTQGENSETEDQRHIRQQVWLDQIDLRNSCLQTATKDFYTQLYRMQIKAGLSKNIPEEHLQEFRELKELQKNNQQDTSKKYAMFITVSPKDNRLSGFPELQKCVEKCIQKYWIKEYAYCYEQRSHDPDDIHGIHAHIMITRGSQKPSHAEREVRSSFKRIVGIPALHINIQWKKKEWVPDKIQEYMSGNKTGLNKNGQPKEIACSVDKYFRKIVGVEDLYSNYKF
ncbi:MAG: putative replicase [Cressdnaviricota sp.]|nr:MAG: putative replicase [Cressdnaviricota sp.]